jgi:hypothetical protein
MSYSTPLGGSQATMLAGIGPLTAGQIHAIGAVNNAMGQGGKMSQIDEITHFGGRGMSIRIVPANGGIIISVRDENNIASTSDLYVVGSEQDLGAEIGKIITMHYLKN